MKVDSMDNELRLETTDDSVSIVNKNKMTKDEFIKRMTSMIQSINKLDSDIKDARFEVEDNQKKIKTIESIRDNYANELEDIRGQLKDNNKLAWYSDAKIAASGSIKSNEAPVPIQLHHAKPHQ